MQWTGRTQPVLWAGVFALCLCFAGAEDAFGENVPTGVTFMAMPTECQTAPTECSDTVTECTTFETECPAMATKCPPAATECPAMATMCPSIETLCPVDDSECPEHEFCTQTPGGWGAPPDGNNPGARLHANFDILFPGGLVVGDPDGPDADGLYSILLTSAQAVTDYLPDGGPAAALAGDETDPAASSAGVFAGHLVAAKINVAFDGPLGELVFVDCVSAELRGLSVNEVMGLANIAISGGGTPAGITINDVKDALQVLNENFVDCEADGGCLSQLPLLLHATSGDSQFLRADANGDGTANVADGIFTLSYLFTRGTAPSCFDAADSNDDGVVDIGDGIYILQFLFANGPGIPSPYPACGIDPTVDALECDQNYPCP